VEKTSKECNRFLKWLTSEKTKNISLPWGFIPINYNITTKKIQFEDVKNGKKRESILKDFERLFDNYHIYLRQYYENHTGQMYDLNDLSDDMLMHVSYVLIINGFNLDSKKSQKPLPFKIPYMIKSFN